MRRFHLVLLLAHGLLFGWAHGAEAKRVLVIHSYHSGLAWTDAVQQGLEKILRASATPPQLTVEHLDALRHRNQLPALRQALRQTLQSKFEGQPPDAIVVSDNDALDFILDERAAIAPDIPIIFCGINGLAHYPPERLTGTTGIAEEASFRETLDVMDGLFPGRRILVIGDRSATFQGNLGSLRAANMKRTPPANIEVFDDPLLSHIEARVRMVQADTLVFFMARPVDEKGKPVAIPLAVGTVTAASPQPVFSGWEFMLGHGIVGGRLISGEAHGEAAASQLLRVLDGTPVGTIPIDRDGTNRYRFDYRALARFQVQDAPLPPESTVIERPVSFYEAHREKVHLTIMAFVVLLVIVLFLVIENLRRRKAEIQLSYIATHDALTGLTNRSLLNDRFRQARAQAARHNRSTACLFLDLDHFKEINDSLGHSIGDELLKSIAERLQKLVRETDTVCRNGGDEFVILLNDLESPQNAATMGDKIIDAMQQPFNIAGNALGVSFSVGISTYPWDGHDFETLLKNADIAMYEAKASGRNAYRFFDASMNTLIQRRSQIHQYLNGAHQRGELSLHIQPQQSLTDNSIVGAEALLRWQSPELGAVSPAEFIPIAESSGQIITLGAWVFEESCRIAADWQKAGFPPIPLAVNVSVNQLRKPRFAEFVRETMARYGLPPNRIEIEITESVFMESIDTIDANLQSIKENGLLLAIDDFGTGYSNLANLKRTGAQRLKIDRAFIQQVVSDVNDAAIVRAIVHIGRSLGMKTIAEGVETQAQADKLERFGCDAMQGYLLSRPVSVGEFNTFFDSFHARHQLTVVSQPDEIAQATPPAVLHPASSVP